MLGDGCIQLSLVKSLCSVGMSGWNIRVEICVEAMGLWAAIHKTWYIIIFSMSVFAKDNLWPSFAC